MGKKLKDENVWLAAPEGILRSLWKEYSSEVPSLGPSWASPLPPTEQDSMSAFSEKPSGARTFIHSPGVKIYQKILEAISFYREWGWRLASLDPLGLQEPSLPEGLHLPVFSDTEKENVLSESPYKGQKVGALLNDFQKFYTGSLALEASHLTDMREKKWLYAFFEEEISQETLTSDLQRKIFEGLVAAEEFEKFLGTKFPGAKRFGLEGLDCLVPLLREGFSFAKSRGIERVVMGLSHRGRLNVMSNVLELPLSWFIERFRGDPIDVTGAGDVKYHLSAETPFVTLLPNPSHLESVDPVVLGAVKALQESTNYGQKSVLGVLVHGDASFVGQGVVTESLILSCLTGYKTGGTVHIILNNQVGFTANPSETSPFSSPAGLVKNLDIPIFHVNADAPDDALKAFWAALSFRQTFGKDSVVHLMGYRRNGHNETDEPTFSQPLLYQAIQQHPSVRELYGQQLVEEQVLSPEGLLEIEKTFREKLSSAFDSFSPDISGRASPVASEPLIDVKGPNAQVIEKVMKGLTSLPQDFSLHPKLTRWMENRTTMLKGSTPLDWSTAEALAFGTLVYDGISLRLSGQDCKRGTFTQRHAVLTDFYNQNTYTPLQSLSKRAQVSILNSPLSEMGVLGFEFGFSLMAPHTLTLWEAQFGDFANGAQVIIDQYIASSFTKWGIRSGLVLLLPHAYEGQGPEHSSARPERFLQLAAEDNIQVANCSTPANYFHLLRRQAYQPHQRPLIIMTPKSLLRHKGATSPLEKFGPENSFQPVLREQTDLHDRVRRVVLCSGKLYYDLLARRDEAKIHVPLIRLEQIYPFPIEELREALAPYGSSQPLLVWAQEEPANNGAWPFLENHLRKLAKTLTYKDLLYAGRPAASSPATGHAFVHLQEQAKLINEALET
jgi:2-oxoglutarate dehydrogenase E1 component